MASETLPHNRDLMLNARVDIGLIPWGFKYIDDIYFEVYNVYIHIYICVYIYISGVYVYIIYIYICIDLFSAIWSPRDSQKKLSLPVSNRQGPRSGRWVKQSLAASARLPCLRRFGVRFFSVMCCSY